MPVNTADLSLFGELPDVMPPGSFDGRPGRAVSAKKKEVAVEPGGKMRIIEISL